MLCKGKGLSGEILSLTGASISPWGTDASLALNTKRGLILDNDNFDGVYICGEEQLGLVCLAGALTMLSDIVEVYTRQEADLRLTEARMFSAFLSRQSSLSHAQRHSPTYPPSPHLWTCQKLGSTLAAQTQTTVTGVGTRVSSCKPSSSCNPDAIGVTSKGSCISPRRPARQRAFPLLSQEQSYL